jgi:hypothetical protein
MGFSHVFHEAKVARRVLATVPMPLVESLLDREPLEEDLMLFEELRVKEIERLVREKEERERRELEEEEEVEEEEEEDDENE